jgi:predicted small lipoprotein YifL
MSKPRAISLLCVMALCFAASACGNKGPLVKPDETPAETTP